MSQDAPTKTGMSSSSETCHIQMLIDGLMRAQAEGQEGDYFMAEIFGHAVTLWAFPTVSEDWDGESILRSNGVLYRCTSTGWRIVSEGMAGHLKWTHHTMPEAAADAEEIANHCADAVRSYLKANWPRRVQELVWARLASIAMGSSYELSEGKAMPETLHPDYRQAAMELCGVPVPPSMPSAPPSMPSAPS